MNTEKPTCDELLNGLKAKDYTSALRSGYCFIREKDNPMKLVATIRYLVKPQLSYQKTFPISGFMPDKSVSDADVLKLWEGINALKGNNIKQAKVIVK